MDSDHRRVDPLPVTDSVLASIVGALESTKSLYKTVIALRERSRTLRRLQDELEDLHRILDSLAQTTDAEKAMLAFAQGPIRQCSQLCHKFEQSLNLFAQEPIVPVRDWMKMEFMGTNMHGFIDTIEEYKSTIAISLGMVTMYLTLPCLPGTLLTSSRHTSPEYVDSIEITAHNIEKHLQWIDEKLGGVAINDTNASLANTDLNHQRKSALLCLRICQDARSHVKSWADRVSAQTPEKATGNGFPNDLTALLRGSQSLNIDGRPPRHNEFPPPGSDNPDLRFINPQKRKVFSIKKAVTAGGSHQDVVATSLVTTSRNQLVGSRRMTDHELRNQVEAHYRHRR